MKPLIVIILVSVASLGMSGPCRAQVVKTADETAVSKETVVTEKKMQSIIDKLDHSVDTFNKVGDGLVKFFANVTNPKVDVTTNGPSETFIGACTGLIMAALGVYRAWGNKHTKEANQSNAELVKTIIDSHEKVIAAVKGNGQ